MRDGEKVKNNILLLTANSDDYYNYSITEDKVYGPFTLGNTGMLSDVVTSGETAVISRFGGGLFYIDITNPNEPEFITSIDIEDYFEEDTEVTPNGKYVLVADGGGGNKVHVASLITKQYVGNYDVSGAQAVAVTPDGKTVLVADFFGNQILVLNMDPDTGILTNTDSIVGDCIGVVNIAISPDGKTALAACMDKVVVMSINNSSGVLNVGEITVSSNAEQIQSIAFNPAGNKAYAVSVSGNIYELNVNGNVTYNNRFVDINKGLVSYFGIDQIAISLDGSKAYVGGLTDKLTVVELTTMTIIKEIQIPFTGFSGIAIY